MDNPVVVGLVIGAALVLGVIVGIIIGIAYRKKVAEAAIGSAEVKAQRIVEEATKQAETLKKEALLEAKGRNPPHQKRIRTRNQGTQGRSCPNGKATDPKGRSPR